MQASSSSTASAEKAGWWVRFFAYFVDFWSQRDGQTIMNKAMGIKVVKTDGSPITVGTAVVRYIGYILNDIIFGIPIGFIWAAFDGNKQGWHDKIAGTIVVKTS
ncbi:MAG: RDD family protein [Chloroflexi bacterium]|nr:MAG: RDD family protein [Chloroflexota bacterium]